MKTHCIPRLICRVFPIWFLISQAGCATGTNVDGALSATPTNQTAPEFSCVVPFELGEAEFAPGDTITIQQVRGTSETIKKGERVCVEGTYTLASREKADLAFFVTTPDPVETRIEPSQIIRVEKGSGSFRLVATMTMDGYPHVSFYSVPSGGSFGGVYFGQGKWVLHHKGFSHLDSRDADRNYYQNHIGHGKGSGGAGGSSATSTGANRVLFEYLGNPVEPPADMDPAYNKEGLTRAIQTAARNGGISVERIEIEDSEFPFLVGVLFKPDDGPKLIEQIKRLKGYVWGGSVDSKTCIAINIVPPSAFPAGAFQRISHRTMLRQQAFYDKMHAQE